MFKRKSEAQTPTEDAPKKAPRWRILNWFTVSVIANVLLFVGLAGLVSASAVLHESDTNPNFCANCHVMEANVDSYLTSNHLDNVHYEAGVMCKDCHSDYSVMDEISSGINYVTGNYVITENDSLSKRDFDDEICTQCHGDMMSVARSTDFLYYNPHNSGMGTFTCDTCHMSHGEQIDYCSECHENGGQRMIEDDAPREDILGAPLF